MMEANNWPSWLSNIWPTWLENIGYPYAGVGDLADLRFSLGIGQEGRWIGFVNSGWYYHNNIEQYKYVLTGTVTGVARYGSSGNVIAPISFRPSWGPVLVYGIADDASGNNDGPYREHHNSFFPAATLTWTALSSAATAVLKATVPASSILVGLRNLTNLPLGSVTGTGMLTNSKVYFYDIASSMVYIKPEDASDLTPDLWADLLYTYPLLRFREIVISETDASGNAIVIPSYQQIQDVKAFRGTLTTLVSGYHASGSIRHSLSSTYKGDWVVLDYWISKSFVLHNHRMLKYFVGGTLSSAFVDDFNVYFENSVPDTHQNITVNTPSSAIFNTFNVNPLFEYGYQTGYLFHGHPASAINSYWVPSKLSMYLDKSEICNSWAEPVKMKLTLLGDNDLPIPYYPITITVSGGSALLKMPEGRSDGRGQVHYLIIPNRTGASTLTIRASCGVLTASAVISIVASSALIDSNKWYDGFVNVVVTNDKTGRGAFLAYVAASMADGLPRDHRTYLTSKLPSEFFIGSDRTLTQKVDVAGSVGIPNIQALAEFGYVPQPNDLLFGYSNNAISKIIKGEA